MKDFSYFVGIKSEIYQCREVLRYLIFDIIQAKMGLRIEDAAPLMSHSHW